MRAPVNGMCEIWVYSEQDQLRAAVGIVPERGRLRLASVLAQAAFVILILAAGQARGDQDGCNVSSFASAEVPQPIPDPGTIESALVVPAGDPVAAVVVHVTITHPFASDLKLELVSPQGTVVTLAEAIGTWGHDFTNTVFDDTAATSVISTLPPFTGTFQPVEPLSTFSGSPSGGTWELRVTDLRAGYVGELQNWSLDITTCPNAHAPQKPVGAPAPPPLPTGVPSGHIPALGTVITVNTNTDDEDGDTTSVAHLLANPGPDGTISLREAIQATDNDPGTWTIRFAPSLLGTTIVVGSNFGLPPLTGGSVLIDGDIDGDGLPDVTIKDGSTSQAAYGLTILSSNNRIHALAFQGFPLGIDLTTPLSGGSMTSHVNLSGNIVSGVQVMSTEVSGPGSSEGIGLHPYYGNPQCSQPPCASNDVWTDIRLVGNRVDADRAIQLNVTGTDGDALERLTIAGNNISIGAPFATGGFGVNVSVAWPLPGGSDNHLSDAVIAYNTIDAEGGAMAINVGVGTGCGSNNVVEDLGVLGNRVHFSDLPSVPEAARGFEFAITDGGDCHPDLFADAVRRVRIIGNTFAGQDDAGVMANEPCCGANAGDVLSDVLISGNLIQGIVPSHELNPWGIVVGGRLSVSNITVDSNTVEQETTDPQTYHVADLAGGGIALVGGLGAPSVVPGVVESLTQSVLITNNRIDTDLAGITLLGGGPSDEDPPTSDTLGHSISGVLLSGNVVGRVPVLATRWDPAIKGISLIGGLGSTPPATPSWWHSTWGCSVTQVILENNLVAGVVDDVSVISNIGDGAYGNLAQLGGKRRAVRFSSGRRRAVRSR